MVGRRRAPVAATERIASRSSRGAVGEGGLVRPSSNRPVVVEVTGYLPTNKLAAGPQYLESFYQANPHFATAARQTNRAVPWQGYPGGSTVRVWRTQREIITGVMRGEISPEAGLERLIKETNALIK